MSAIKEPSEQQVLVRQGKKHYLACEWEPAFSSFKEACLRCTCNQALVVSTRKLGLQLKDVPIPTCHCRDFRLLASDNGDTQAMWKLANKICTCGSGLVPCKSELHIEAFSNLIIVSEKLMAYEQAYKYASLLVIMAPHAPEGYMRMVKALCLLDPSNSSGSKDRCRWICQQCMQNVRLHGCKHHVKMRMLQALIRKDILGSLPPELQLMILEHFSQPELCTFMRVSKSWNNMCRNRSLWAHIKFIRHWEQERPRPLRPGVLNDIVLGRSMKLAKSLTIHSLRDFGIDDVKLQAVLTALPHLEHLSLWGFNPKARFLRPDMFSDRTTSFKRVLTAIWKAAPASLKILRLEAFHHREDAYSWTCPEPPQFMDSLEEFTIINHSAPELAVEAFEAGFWPRLEKLTIQGNRTSYWIRSPVFNVEKCLKCTPALKDLTVDTFNPPNIPGNGSQTLWGNLQRLSTDKFIPKRHSPRLPPTLRSLEINEAGFEAIVAMFTMRKLNPETQTAAQVPLNPPLKDLVHFRCHNSKRLYNDEFFRLVATGLESIAQSSANGTLRSLDIVFDSDLISALDQVLNKEAIRTLSCHDIRMSTIDTFQEHDDTFTFLEWVKEFPNVTTIGVYPEQKDVLAWSYMSTLLRRKSNIRTIYTNVPVGAFRDQMLELAAKQGIEIIYANRVPEPVLEPLAAKVQLSS